MSIPDDRKGEATEAPAIRTVRLGVDGMTCASCVRRVEKALGKIDGVSSANVNLATEEAAVDLSNTEVSLESIRDAIRNAGYEVREEPEPPAIAALENSISAATEPQQIKRDPLAVRLVVSTFLTVPVFIISMLGMFDWFQSGWFLSPVDTQRLLFVLTTVVMIYPARGFFAGCWNEMKHAAPGMDSLVAMGTAAAYLYSTVVVLFPSLLGLHEGMHEVYFETAAVIVTLILFGRFLEARAKRKATDSIASLMELRPVEAAVWRGNAYVRVPVGEVHPGDRIQVKPGEKVPVDGIISEGTAVLDQSIMTGESMPVEKNTGDSVAGGTVNTYGSFIFTATAVGEHTLLARIIQVVRDAQGSKAPVQRLVDKIAAVFVPVVMSIALLTFLYWLLIAGTDFSGSLIHAIAVLIIACPCALGLATPTAIIAGIGVGAQRGILIKNAESLERARNISTIVLDKTGTITEGKPAVDTIESFNGYAEEEILIVAAAAEMHSEHPLANAIVEAARERKRDIPTAGEFSYTGGMGIAAQVDGKHILAGNAALMQRNAIVIDGSVPAAEPGSTTVYVAIDGALAGRIALKDTVKTSSKEAIRWFRDNGIDVVMLTGDARPVAEQVASETGIHRIHAEVLPEAKAGVVREEQSTDQTVAMIGDGVNDAPALAVADVSIAMGAGADIAMETADITLMHGDLLAAADAVRLSRATIRKIKQNLFWAFFYNVVSIPLAASGFLDPMIAATAMAFSSVSVVSNSLLLKRFK